MDFTKLVSLLDSGCLFFTRADRFKDPFEGSWAKMDVEGRSKLIEEAPMPERAREAFRQMAKSWGETNKNWSKYHAINCWHMNEHESAAMWKLYLKSDEGIAVQSTYQRFRDSFLEEEPIFLGLVKYIDYERDSIHTNHRVYNGFSPFMHKRKSFEHEQEVRAIVPRFPTGQTRIFTDEITIDQGVKLKVDLERLIERIFVAPSSPLWFVELLKEVIKRYGFTFKVEQSHLDSQPVW